MEPLQEKTLALLIQLPPSMEIMPGLEGLKELQKYRRKRIWKNPER
jgi:hypothetical protein